MKASHLLGKLFKKIFFTLTLLHLGLFPFMLLRDFFGIKVGQGGTGALTNFLELLIILFAVASFTIPVVAFLAPGLVFSKNRHHILLGYLIKILLCWFLCGITWRYFGIGDYSGWGQLKALNYFPFYIISSIWLEELLLYRLSNKSGTNRT